MKRRDPDPLNRIAVLGGRVADVSGELPARMRRIRPAHIAVPGLLCDHGRCGDRGALRVSADHRPLLVPELRHGKAVAEADAAGARDPRERVAERRQIGHVQAPRIDSRGATGHDHHLRRRPQDHREHRCPRLG